MLKLTKRKIDAAEIRDKEYFLWDDTLPGFGLRVLPSGRKSYIVQYRAGRRARRMSLGPNTVLACEQAQGQAITILAAVRKSEDPSADGAAQRNAINMTELAQRFDAEQISIRLK